MRSRPLPSFRRSLLPAPCNELVVLAAAGRFSGKSGRLQDDGYIGQKFYSCIIGRVSAGFFFQITDCASHDVDECRHNVGLG